ncbi:MAG: HAMP domain-containing histidine kinase [Chloroflexi bacterium]|nr:HAMP domain-containing histidine kinase [Chloroflexota bacterium]
MRRLILLVPLVILLLWGLPPFFIWIFSGSIPVTLLAADVWALLWWSAALIASAAICFGFGWHGANTDKQRVWPRFLLLAGLLLGVCWLVLPTLWSILRETQQPPMTVRIIGLLPLLWLLIAVFGTALTLVLIGQHFRVAYEQARYQQHLLRIVHEQLNEGVALFDLRQRLQWANIAAQNALFHQQQLQPDAARLLQRALETQRSASQNFAVSETMRVNIQANPLMDNAASVITRPLQNDSDQSNFYERFIRRIVHDMRNPLAAITAHASNLYHTPDGDSAAKNTALTIENEAQRLTRLVDSLLFDARLSYVPLALEPLDLADVVEEVFFQHDERAIREGKTLEIETLPAPLEADRDLLVRALSNLVDNSLKYSKPGAVVRIGLEATPTAYTIRIRDNGDGIPPDYLPDRIFEALVRVRPKDGGGGSGLGLSIVKKIVELHGGQISVESTLGQGTVMTLCLPK